LRSLSLPRELRRLTFKIRRVTVARGVYGLLGMVVLRLLSRPAVLGRQIVEHPFDIRHGVQTGGLISQVANEDHFAYYGISPSVFQEVLRHWLQTLASPADVERYSFIDVGSGLGRALLLATALPFREVIGVESIANFVTGAKKNIEIWATKGHKQPSITLYQQDALDFRFPSAPVIIFLYNPFGENTLRQLLARLQATYQGLASSIDVLYCHPKFGYVLTEGAMFKELWMKAIPLNEEDRSADIFFSEVEVCAMYRLVYAR
jgi:SAM-dependent methyltransferase